MNDADDMARTQVRIPGDIYRRLVAEAKASGRSMNAELVHRLGLGFESRLTIPQHLDAQIREAAEASGSSFEAEALQRLRDSGDVVYARLREAFEALRPELARAAENNGISIHDEIRNRLSSHEAGITFCYEITIHNEAELSTQAALKFISDLLNDWPTELQNLGSVVVRLVEPKKQSGKGLLPRN